MATRYSGDVKLNVRHTGGGTYVVTTTVYRGFSSMRGPRCVLRGPKTPTSEAYDGAAREALKLFPGLPVTRERGRIIVRRTFQSPCPIRV